MIDFISIPEERMELLKTDKTWKIKFRKLSDVKTSLDTDVKLESSDPISLKRAKEVFIAFGRGFEFDNALNMLDEDFLLEIIEIKYFTKSENRMKILKGRVIGTGGKIKKLIERISATKIAVYGKTICIIGKWNDVKLAAKAIEMLLLGSKHSSVMRYIKENKNL